jgi:hypothetical protein
MDLQLISDLTGLDPQRIAHIVEGDGRCTYRIDVNNNPQMQDSPLLLSVTTGSLSNV